MNVMNLDAGAPSNAIQVGMNVASAGAQSGTVTLNLSSNGATTSGLAHLALADATASINAVGYRAGTFTGNPTLDIISTGAGTTNAADLSVGSSDVILSGRVDTAAVGSVQSTVDFGIVHVGELAQQGVAVSNSAPVSALNDTLLALLDAATGAFTRCHGSVANRQAGGAANSTAAEVTLDPSTSGVFSGRTSVSLVSQDPDLADPALQAQVVALRGKVNNFADAAFVKTGGAGTLSRNDDQFNSDFGQRALGSSALTALVGITYPVAGPADARNGSLVIVDGNEFATSLLLTAVAHLGT